MAKDKDLKIYNLSENGLNTIQNMYKGVSVLYGVSALFEFNKAVGLKDRNPERNIPICLELSTSKSNDLTVMRGYYDTNDRCLNFDAFSILGCSANSINYLPPKDFSKKFTEYGSSWHWKPYEMSE